MKNKLTEENSWEFKSPNQIMSMGGPWVGDLYINDEFVANDIVMDNEIINEMARHIFFVKFFNVSRWRSKNYFKINFYDLNTKHLFEFDRKFDMVFISKYLDKSNLEIYHAFHDKILERKDVFNILDEKFTESKST